MKKQIQMVLSLVLLLVLSHNQAHAEPPAFKTTTANIVAWNLAGFNPIPNDKIEVFASAIKAMDPELIALVEINPDSILGDIVDNLSGDGICYEKTILSQTSRQNIGLLHKCGVAVSNQRLIDDSDNNNPGLRKALAADVKIGEFDFIIVTVHLKAGRGKAKRNIRDNQTKAIAKFIKNVTTNNQEKDVLVVGDYNMIHGEDGINFSNLNPTDFLYFPSVRLSDQYSHISSSGPGNLLDGYAISKKHTKNEYIKNSIRIVPLHEIMEKTPFFFRKEVSDHLPLEASFKITDDDD